MTRYSKNARTPAIRRFTVETAAPSWRSVTAFAQPVMSRRAP
jgi:hypothetical protein